MESTSGCIGNVNCPSIAETPDGDFDVVGLELMVPQPGQKVGYGEAGVRVPREVMLAFLGDFSEKVLQLRLEAISEGLSVDIPEAETKAAARAHSRWLIGKPEGDWALRDATAELPTHSACTAPECEHGCNEEDA
jgi:hypothetical protein